MIRKTPIAVLIVLHVVVAGPVLAAVEEVTVRVDGLAFPNFTTWLRSEFDWLISSLRDWGSAGPV